MKQYIAFLLSTTVFLACTSNHKSTFPSQEIVNEKMDSALGKTDLKGLVAIAINKNGEKLIYENGKAVWEENADLSSNHIFRIASMTKLITSIAALQLVELELLKLDDDLSELMPEMTKIPILSDGELLEPKNPITLRHLLTHSSGFGYGATDEQLANFDANDNWAEDDLPRRFESGTQFLYGTSLDWTGKLVEKLSKKSLEDYFRDHITGPLEMNRTWFNVPDSLKSEIVSYGGHGGDGKGELTEYPNRIPENPTTTYGGGGGLFSSPDDYTKLLECILNDGVFEGGRILTASTIDEMFKNQIGSVVLDIEGNYFNEGSCCNFNGLIDKSSKWGLGGMIYTEPTSYGRKAGSLSWGGAFNSYFVIDRESGIAVSIYAQYFPFNDVQTTDLFNEFASLIYSPE